MMEAVETGHENIVKLLVNSRARDNDEQSISRCFETMLSFAVEEGHKGIVKLLLEKVDANSIDPEGYPVLWTAIKRGKQGIIKLIIEKGAHLGLDLLLTALRLDEDMFRLLLDMGANFEDEDEYGETLLSNAIRDGYGSTHMVRY
ncbi:hypothetical protein TWF506_007505 [Arthrobotrys conoides]|uniref:Ankyrin n=1 Tax=Arthrobotrys conoides TaxID=74498 RepID=A0AAN8RY41_9PEZI